MAYIKVVEVLCGTNIKCVYRKVESERRWGQTLIQETRIILGVYLGMSVQNRQKQLRRLGAKEWQVKI